MTEPTTLAAALLRDVPRINGDRHFLVSDIHAVLTAALDPAIAERAEEFVNRLRDDGLIATRAESADLITVLLAQNAALRAERDALIEWNGQASVRAESAEDRAETAEAQIAALTARVEVPTEAIAAEALRYADFYEVGSDPRNTFVMFAEWVKTRAALSTTTEADNG